jgi:hypothetical protein
MTACFVGPYGQDGTYEDYATVGVINCKGSLLWRLPYAPSCKMGYCTVKASGL